MDEHRRLRSPTKLVGDHSSAMILARILPLFDAVLVPFGENQRYDLVAEQGPKLLRIQCKTGRLRLGAIIFPTCSTVYQRPRSAAAAPGD